MRKALNHYLAGLAYEGMGETEKAKTEFTRAIDLDPGHLWSRVHLEGLTKKEGIDRPRPN